MFSVTADYFQEDCHVAGTGGMEGRIKASVPCSTFFCINTAWGREHYWIIWYLPQRIQQRLHSFEHQWEKGTKNKTTAAQGRFPPPSFFRATALRTRVYSPSNLSSASSRSQPSKSMVHKHFRDCANAHSWWKQRTWRKLVKLKGNLAPYNPVSNTCRDNPHILDNSLIQRPTELIHTAMIGFESGIAFLNWDTSQFLKLQHLPWCCSCIVKDSLHSWSDHLMNEFCRLVGMKFYGGPLVRYS